MIFEGIRVLILINTGDASNTVAVEIFFVDVVFKVMEGRLKWHWKLRGYYGTVKQQCKILILISENSGLLWLWTPQVVSNDTKVHKDCGAGASICSETLIIRIWRQRDNSSKEWIQDDMTGNRETTQQAMVWTKCQVNVRVWYYSQLVGNRGSISSEQTG